MADTLNKTQPVGSRNQLSPAVRRFRLVVLEGPDTGTAWESTDERCSIGQERGNELVLTDTTVSRFHCELEATDHGVRLKDLGSLNGVLVDGVHVLEGYLKSGSTLRLGRTVLRFDFAHEPNPLKLSANDLFKIKALEEIVLSKLTKRGIDLKCIDRKEPEISPLGHARQSIKLKQGIDHENGKKITAFIRDGKFKVTSQVQEQQVRVTAKSRDELQEVIAALRAHDFPVAINFQNFRD